MMRPLFLAFLLLPAFSCSMFEKKPLSLPPSPPEWRFEKNAILFRLKADINLNLYEANSHTLVLCLYQLTDPNALNQMRGDAEGLSKLLECRRFDATVTQARRLVANPGQEWTESMDRAEGTKYVAIVAGYYDLNEDKILRLMEIPVVEEKTPSGVARKPAKLYKDINLGPQEIQPLRGMR
jgi:type VI secretion system VasD/TssJ family lipoprotein